jgi:succinate dehydrogenase/fumarate reductase flavoprotein subunit
LVPGSSPGGPTNSEKATDFEVSVLVQASITFTCGGIFTDMDMRVLRRSSSISSLALVTADVSELQTQPIANLFAAGCDVGGFSGHGYVGGLSQALVTGLIAGEEAARSVKSLEVQISDI